MNLHMYVCMNEPTYVCMCLYTTYVRYVCTYVCTYIQYSSTHTGHSNAETRVCSQISSESRIMCLACNLRVW